MAIRTVVTLGFGNGTFTGTIKDLVRLGYSNAALEAIDEAQSKILTTQNDSITVIGNNKKWWIIHNV